MFSDLFTGNPEISYYVLLSDKLKIENNKHRDLKYHHDARIFSQNLVVTLLNDDSYVDKIDDKYIGDNGIFRFFLLKQYKELKDKGSEISEIEKKRLKNAENLIRKYLKIGVNEKIEKEKIQKKILNKTNISTEKDMNELLDLAYLGLVDFNSLDNLTIDFSTLESCLKNFNPFLAENLNISENVLLNKNLVDFIIEYCKKDIENGLKLVENFFYWKQNNNL